MSRLKPGVRRREKAGLEGRKEVCILVQETCYREHTAFRHARLGSVQTGKLLLIGHCTVMVQAGRAHLKAK